MPEWSLHEISLSAMVALVDDVRKMPNALFEMLLFVMATSLGE